MQRMKIKEETGEGLGEPKGHQFKLVDAKEAYQYEDALKKIGKCVGRACGKEMKNVAINHIKIIYARPMGPSRNNSKQAEEEQEGMKRCSIGQMLGMWWKRKENERCRIMMILFLQQACTWSAIVMIEAQITGIAWRELQTDI